MAKVKYYYDSDTLSYKKIKNKISVVLKRISLAIISAFMTEYFHPKWCILVYSMLGFFIAYSGIKLNPEIDREGLDEMNGFWTDLKRSGRDIY